MKALSLYDVDLFKVCPLKNRAKSSTHHPTGRGSSDLVILAEDIGVLPFHQFFVFPGSLNQARQSGEKCRLKKEERGQSREGFSSVSTKQPASIVRVTILPLGSRLNQEMKTRGDCSLERTNEVFYIPLAKPK